MREPKLVLVRQPCPWCGAKTAKEAERICRPPVSCPASDMTDARGYIVAPTPESFEAWRKWDAQQ